MGYWAVGVLLIIIAALAARLFMLGREIKKAAHCLRALNAGETGKKLTISLSHAPLETLCQEINLGLEARDKARIGAAKQEAALRSQIANISHDLRTPLTAMLGYLTMLRAAPENSAEYLTIIESRSKALQALVEQFYELSIADDTRTALSMAAVDLTALLTHCLLGHYALFEEKGLALETRLPKQALTVISNAQALERVFQNLIQNALQYAESRVTVSLTKEGDLCVLSIANDTTRLTATDVDRLFERFFTADKARAEGGTGLGLYIVKRLLEKINGGVRRAALADGRFTLEVYFSIN